MKILVLGSGITAMMASYALREHDLECWSPSGQFGGHFLTGPFRLIRATSSFCDALEQLGLSFETFTTQPGIMLSGGQVEPLPDAFARIRPDRALAIKTAYATKSRGKLSADFVEDLEVYEPENVPETALDFDLNAFRKMVADDTDLHSGNLRTVDIKKQIARFFDGSRFHEVNYDRLIVACPMQVFVDALEPKIGNKCPRITTNTCDLVFVRTASAHDNFDVLVGYDVIWTPETPARALMRLTHSDKGYCCEFRADSSQEAIDLDLAYALPLGYKITRKISGIRSMSTLDRPGKLPKNVYAIGPHSTGEFTTPDATLNELLEIFA